MTRSHRESDRPISMTESKRLTLPLTMLLALLAASATAAISYNRLESKADDHEERIKRVEEKTEDIAVIKNDLSWIRRTMEADEQRRARLAAGH